MMMMMNGFRFKRHFALTDSHFLLVAVNVFIF
jgi:hypothetical protein